MKIYLDMDGVLTDFHRKYREMFGVDPKTVDKKSVEAATNWEAIILSDGFASLDWFPGGQDLIKHVDALGVPVEILTSSGGLEHHDNVREQKIRWARSHGLFYKMNVVPSGKKKGEFAAPDSILIDDTDYVVNNFVEQGGRGIIHKDVTTTLFELHKHMKDIYNERYVVGRF